MAEEEVKSQESVSSPVRPKKSRKEREAEVLKRYDFSVIRSLRQARGLTIEKFAKICGLSYAPISRIETNLIKPNLDTLDKIAGGLGITTYSLVALAERRNAEKLAGRTYQTGGFSFTTFSFDQLDISYGEAVAGAESQDLDVRDRQFEFVTVQQGLLEVTVNGRAFQVAAGESLRHDRIFPRRYRALESTKLIVIGLSPR